MLILVLDRNKNPLYISESPHDIYEYYARKDDTVLLYDMGTFPPERIDMDWFLEYYGPSNDR